MIGAARLRSSDVAFVFIVRSSAGHTYSLAFGSGAASLMRPIRSNWNETDEGPLLGTLREAIRDERVVKLSYADETGRTTERAVWPITIAFYDDKQIVAAWCTLREGFRNFRTDRIEAAAIIDGRFGKRRAQLAREWEDQWQEERRARYPADSP